MLVEDLVNMGSSIREVSTRYRTEVMSRSSFPRALDFEGQPENGERSQGDIFNSPYILSQSLTY